MAEAACGGATGVCCWGMYVHLLSRAAQSWRNRGSPMLYSAVVFAAIWKANDLVGAADSLQGSSAVKPD